jgi:hypothetical protein
MEAAIAGPSITGASGERAEEDPASTDSDRIRAVIRFSSVACRVKLPEPSSPKEPEIRAEQEGRKNTAIKIGSIKRQSFFFMLYIVTIFFPKSNYFRNLSPGGASNIY